MSTDLAALLDAVRALPRDERVRLVEQLVEDLQDDETKDERVAALVARWQLRWDSLHADDRALIEAAVSEDRKHGPDGARGGEGVEPKIDGATSIDG